jgi:hypothetical protein
MSHFTTIAVQVKDLDALRTACAELGLEVIANAEARGYKRNRLKGDYVIKLKGPYDIAVERQKDGRWALTADLWQGHVEREVGPGDLACAPAGEAHGVRNPGPDRLVLLVMMAPKPG